MKRLPMGLKTSPKAFAQVIENLVKHMPSIVPYMDDICVRSHTFKQHLKDLEQLFKVFHAANIKFKKEKCAFALREVPFLGFLVSKEGIKPDPEKVAPIATYPAPKNVKQIRSFAGMCNYYRSLIKNYASIMKPLYRLTKKKVKFVWTNECEVAFNKIKKAICSDVVLKSPDFSKEFVLATDASDIALGACLSQKDRYGNIRPVAFAGRNLIDAELKYSTTRKELQGVKFGLTKFKSYLLGRKFTILTDHSALLAINEKEVLTTQMMRMLDFFNQFDYVILHLKGRLNITADLLSRRRYPVDEEVEDDEEHCEYRKAFRTRKGVTFSPIQHVKLFHDVDPLENYPINMHKLPSILKTQNMAQNREQFEEQIINQITTRKSTHVKSQESQKLHKSWMDGKIRKGEEKRVGLPKIMPEQTEVEKLKQQSKRRASWRKIPTGKSEGMMSERMWSRMMEDFGIPIVLEEFVSAQEDDPFCKRIKDFIEMNELPENDYDARKLLLEQDQYFENGGVLCRLPLGNQKRMDTEDFQVVVPVKYRERILEMAHTQPMASHQGVTRTCKNLAKSFYWQGLIKDATNFVLTCHKCLVSKKMRRKVEVPMTLRDPSPGPMMDVCVDAVGPMPRSVNGNKYIQVMVCFYLRFCMAWPTKTIDSARFSGEFFSKVLCVHGIPRRVFSDNGPTYIGEEFRDLCKIFAIEQRLGTPYRPQTQGLVERMNGTIVQTLRTYVQENQKDWDLFLDTTVFAINNCEIYSAGISPFLLMYGRNARVPGQEVLQNLDITSKPVVGQLLEKMVIQSKAARTAHKRLGRIHEKMKERHDFKVKEIVIEPGMVVYVEIHRLLYPGTAMKLQPTHAGPYLIVSRPSSHTVKIRRLDNGKLVIRPVSITFLKTLSPELSEEFLKRVITPDELDKIKRNGEVSDNGNPEAEIGFVWDSEK